MPEGEIAISLRERLLKERHALLDLSTRNRLLNTPLRTNNNRAIEIVDERSTEIFRLLSDGKSLTFLPGVQLGLDGRAGLDDDDTETAGIPEAPENEGRDESGVALRHKDLKLQTRLTTEGLHRKLFDIWYDARTLEEDQGVNILYLAIGLMRWYDKETSDIARHAPLVLLPVQLERSTAADRFKLKARQEPPSPNLSLQAKLDLEFGLKLEDFHDEDALDLPAYFQRVADSISKQSRWEVLPDAMVLGFFSFAKFLMYRDLDPENWPTHSPIDSHTLISGLLRDGFPESEPLIPDEGLIDPILPNSSLNHVVDADSSQAIAIAEAVGGRTMVVKGPPGTGKSQTITNIIAGAVAQGKKVLFVAEKMAALEVVHRRLQKVGLGPLALELHSNKANKKAILEELRRTKEAVLKPLQADASVVSQLNETTEALNSFAGRLHQCLQPCGLTPYEILSRLIATSHEETLQDYTLDDSAASWRPADLALRQRLVSELAERLVPLGPLPSHPWRGITRGAVDPEERGGIARRLRHILELIGTVQDSAAVARSLGAKPVHVLADLNEANAVLAKAATLPVGADRAALKDPLWANSPELLRSCVESGDRSARCEAAIVDNVTEAAWRFDFQAMRLALATQGPNPFRFLLPSYRAQIALFKSMVRGVPRGVTARLQLLGRIMEAQEARRSFEASRHLGAAFGTCWKEEHSDWAHLREWVSWREHGSAIPDETYPRLAGAGNLTEITQAARVLATDLPALQQAISDLFLTLQIDTHRAFSVGAEEKISLSGLAQRLTEWRDDLEGLTRFIAFAERGREAASFGLSRLVEAIHDGKLGPQDLRLEFDRAYAGTLRTVLFQAWPELRAFDGDTRDRLVSWFCQLDRQRIELAKEQIAANHAAGRPRGAGGIGPLGVLNAEIAKKRGLKPLRLLLEHAGPAIQQLKPVFMMSPLSVAQYLKPGALSFDILVMDEASQIEPVDALGAVARARQFVVVGDERQLPPTAFFKKLTGDLEKDNDDDGLTIQAKDAESILDLCLAKGAPYRMLNWHYRSKHQSLIAVSNKEFYENKLFIVPSPYDAMAGMGLKFHLLEDAPYDRGNTRTNVVEARAIADAVMLHARRTPDISLGVATFSVAQRQAINNELELRRRAQPELEDFFSKSSVEPFFVKNLENIQGDERDVIFISVGYGKTEQGYLAHAFGPLSLDGGERRLNVLISRAKTRCDVFSNFTGADIDPERTRARGVMALKMFLTFAETGKFGMGEASGQDHDSGFEAQVANRLRGKGYDVRAQIGASGFRVDLAICDPEKPGRFLLGIECDGAQYHSSRSARDRDRLRQQVLEAHGWIIHRIWSADWYLRPREELRKVEEAIASALAEWRERDEHVAKPDMKAVPPLSTTGRTGGEEAFRTTADGDTSQSPASQAYREASFSIQTALEPHETPELELLEYVVQVVAVEGPVHIDEIVVRIRSLWGLKRAGARIHSAVAKAATMAARVGRITGDPFYILKDQPIIVRDRSHVTSASLRKTEMLPPAEIDQAILDIVERNFGAERSDLITEVARAFGFSSTSNHLKSALDQRIEALINDRRLVVKDQLLVRPS